MEYSRHVLVNGVYELISYPSRLSYNEIIVYYWADNLFIYNVHDSEEFTIRDNGSVFVKLLYYSRFEKEIENYKIIRDGRKPERKDNDGSIY